MIRCSFHLEAYWGRGMASIGQGLPAGVTCESLGVNEDPLNDLPIFLAQLQVDLTGAVSLGPVGQGWEEGK